MSLLATKERLRVNRINRLKRLLELAEKDRMRELASAEHKYAIAAGLVGRAVVTTREVRARWVLSWRWELERLSFYAHGE